MKTGLLAIISIAFSHIAVNVIPVVTPVWPMVARRKHMSSRVIVTGTSGDTHRSIACTAERYQNDNRQGMGQIKYTVRHTASILGSRGAPAWPVVAA